MHKLLIGRRFHRLNARMARHWRKVRSRVVLISVVAVVVSLLLVLAKAYIAPSAHADVAPGARYDAYGNVVREDRSRFNYLVLPNGFSRVQLSEDGETVRSQRLSTNPFDGLATDDALTPEPDLTGAASSASEYLTQKWKTGIWGTGIGASGISALDIDHDGKQEIVVGGGYGFGGNRFWYVLSYSTESGNYLQEWLSEQYSTTISRIIVADVGGDGQYEIYVALSNGEVQIYDATTREVQDSFSAPFGNLADMTISDVDNDGDQEIVTISSSGLAVNHAETYAAEWQTSSYSGDDVEVANVDGDAAPEIVTTGHVIDGISHALEWDYTAQFGAIVQLADIDADGMAEIIAAEDWYQINAFDADVQSPKWDFPADLDIDAMIVTDFDEDGVQEVVYGDGQWGSVYVIDSTTLTEEWSVSNPEHGVAGIGFGDVDNDGVLEILWGAGWTSTGSDHLFIASTVTHSREWQSQHIDGPLSALDVDDVDNDGTNEIVMVSFESDSGYDDGIIFIYDAETYELEWQSDPILGGLAWTGVHALELADVDNDDVLEILIATADVYDGIIMAYDGITHNLDWRTADHEGTFFSALDVFDVDNDGQLEVIGGQDREHTGASGVYVRVFDGSTGVEEWRTTDLTYWGGVYDIDAGNFDADGNPEILFSVSDGSAYVYDGVTHIQEWESSFSNTRAVAGLDIDQDGVVELLVGTSSGQLYAFDGQTYTQEWSESLSSQSLDGLRLADFNRDTVLELVLTDDAYLFVYEAATRDLVWQSENLGTDVGRGGHLIVDDIDRDTRDEVVVGSNYALYVFTYSLLPYGSLLEVDQGLATPDDVLHYTVKLVNFSDEVLSAAMTDTVPADTLYETGSLWASGGSCNIIDDTIAWTVDLAASEVASLTFAVTVNSVTADATHITNTAVFTAATFQDVRTVSTIIDALPPASTIVKPVAGEIVSGTVYAIAGTADDTVSGVDFVEICIDGSEWQPALGTQAWVYTWTLPMVDDSFTIEVRSVDRMGHIEAPGPSISVLVDNLSPYIVSTVPDHGSSGVPINMPISVIFSEPVQSDTLELICQPDVDILSASTSIDETTVVISHTGFAPNQMYSCLVSQVQDRAGHDLVSGTAFNPWAFVTSDQVLDRLVYLPLVRVDS